MNIHISCDGQKLGPYPIEEVKKLLDAGSLAASDLAWFEGAPNWIPLSQVPGLSIPPAPPPPPTPHNPVTSTQNPAVASEETEVFTISPSAKAFIPEIALGILLLVIIVGIFILIRVWIRIRSVSYKLTTQRLFITRGWLSKQRDQMELYRVKDVALEQSVFERLLHVGTVKVFSNDDTTPIMLLSHISNPDQVFEIVRKAYRESRRREGVRATEFMQP